MKKGKRSATPVEYSLLLTATLCLLAFGVVMVFSASSTTSLLGESGDSAFYLKRTVIFGALGLVVMHLLARRGLKPLRPLTPLLLAGAFFLLRVVMLPGVGVEVNGSRAWLGAGPAPDPALGADEGGADPVRRPAARHAARRSSRAASARWCRC